MPAYFSSLAGWLAGALSAALARAYNTHLCAALSLSRARGGKLLLPSASLSASLDSLPPFMRERQTARYRTRALVIESVQDLVHRRARARLRTPRSGADALAAMRIVIGDDDYRNE